MRLFDSKLGVPLVEKSYAESCDFSEIWDKVRAATAPVQRVSLPLLLHQILDPFVLA